MQLDALSRRLRELEVEVAAHGRQWSLVTSAADTDELTNRRSQYYEALTTFFDEEELNTLCFELNIEYEALPASGFYGKVRELLEYAERHNKMEQLKRKMLKKRRFLELD